jgi:hypothetical protein
MIRKPEIPLLKFNSPSDWFALEYPDTWTLEEDSDCTTLYKTSGGVGAFQISGYETDAPQSPESSLREYFADRGIVISEIDQYRTDGQLLACSTFEDNGSYTKVCFLSKGTRLLFLTYNCDAVDKASEIEEVDEIIHSITIKL